VSCCAATVWTDTRCSYFARRFDMFSIRICSLAIVTNDAFVSWKESVHLWITRSASKPLVPRPLPVRFSARHRDACTAFVLTFSSHVLAALPERATCFVQPTPSVVWLTVRQDTIVRQSPGTCLVRLAAATQNVGPFSRCAGRGLNRGPPEQEAGPRHSVP
jgi:hypothetical protein